MPSPPQPDSLASILGNPDIRTLIEVVVEFAKDDDLGKLVDGLSKLFKHEDARRRITEAKRFLKDGHERDRLDEIVRFLERGDHLGAYDAASNLLEKYPNSLGAKYHAVIALGRCGFVDMAEELAGPERWNLAETSKADLAGLAGAMAFYRAQRERTERKRKCDESKSHENGDEKSESDSQPLFEEVTKKYLESYQRLASAEAYLVRERVWRTSEQDARDLKQQYARRAAEMFVEVYEQTGGVLSGMNAAAMYFLADEVDTASALATRVAQGFDDDDASPDSLVAKAIEYVLHLKVGKFEATMEELGEQWNRDARLARVANLWRQIDSVYEKMCSNLEGSSESPGNRDRRIFDACNPRYRSPCIVHYGGHMIGVGNVWCRFHADEEVQVREEIETRLAEHNVGAGYGGLACGADILFAEALLDRGAELHVVVPFRVEDFVNTSVRAGGPEWIDRFERARERATSVQVVSEDQYLGHPDLFLFGSRIAMGAAIMRHRTTRLPLKQILVWDGEQTGSPAGTYRMKVDWRWKQDYVSTKGKKTGNLATRIPEPVEPSERAVKALLFGDVKGFSKLDEQLVPVFWEVVIGGLWNAIQQFKEKHPDSIAHFNTWGDAVYLVVDTVENAAECALRLLDTVENIDREKYGFPKELSMRFGAHVGAVFPRPDPLNEQEKNFLGSQVARAARIEPVTEAGQIFVSEPFACALAFADLSPAGEYGTDDEGKKRMNVGEEKFDCRYVGYRSAAKDYGAFRMYRLTRRKGHDDRAKP